MDRLDEDSVLCTCALRFDGWKYVRDTGFDWNQALERLISAGAYPAKREEQLCLFFMLQRGLYKWGLEHEPRHGRCWRLFRSLFLLVYGYDVPEEYRLAEWHEEWEQRFRPRLSECVDLVQGIHEGTQYDDSE